MPISNRTSPTRTKSGHAVTRFKELSRIEAAIENKDEPELKWALSDCKMRISIAFNKRHVQAWRIREQVIEKALQELNEDSN
jgi:head-tail adaptor